jgi:hypothetical protein
MNNILNQMMTNNLNKKIDYFNNYPKNILGIFILNGFGQTTKKFFEQILQRCGVGHNGP